MYTTERCFNLENSGLKYDLAFTGIWVGQEEFNFTKTLNETEEEFEKRKKNTLEARNSQMNSEENPQGLIKNERVDSLTKSDKTAVLKFSKQYNETNKTMLQNIDNMQYRQTIKIINANNIVPIKVKHTISNDTINLEKIAKDQIIFTIDEAGNAVGASYNLDEDKVNYIFYVGDSEGNVVKHQLVYREPGKPDLKGFNVNTTFYVAYDENGNESSVVPIGEKKPFGWYNYEESKWANIVIRDNGQENYYVWIPRYKYILNAETESAEVKLVDLDNYWMDENNELVELGEEWQLPDAFTWENENGEKVQIWGYWISKFKLRESGTPNLNIVPGSEKITIKDVEVTSGYTYEVYLIKDGKRVILGSDGTLIEEKEQPYATFTGGYVIKEIPAGTYGVNIIIRNSAKVQVGAISKEVVVAENLMKDPDLTGFNPATTYCVLYDSNGNEVENIPIGEVENLTDEQREEWYNYDEQKWANIVIRESNKENYFVWIPRYEYKLNSGNEEAEVMLIEIDQTTPSDGYQIPDAFSWNGEPIAGYWISKFKLREDTDVGLSAAVSGSADSITVSNIVNNTGLTIRSYEITLVNEEGKMVGEPHVWTSSDSALGYYRFTNLDSGKYTVSIIGKSSLAGLGTIQGGLTQEIVIYKVEQPSLIGYNVDYTSIVAYNDSGTEYTYLLRNVLTEGSEIDSSTNQLISGQVDLSKITTGVWYNYAEQKWANIKITSDGKENYFVWIPRYEYKLDDLSQSATAILIPVNKTTADTGYQIPDAFTWNGTPISGYWISKFKLRE